MKKAEQSFINCETTLTILEVLCHKCIFEDETTTEDSAFILLFTLVILIYKNQNVGFTIVWEVQAFEELVINVW